MIDRLPHKTFKSTLSDWLIGKSEMAEAIRTLDWSRTALGPRDRFKEPPVLQSFRSRAKTIVT